MVSRNRNKYKPGRRTRRMDDSPKRRKANHHAKDVRASQDQKVAPQLTMTFDPIHPTSLFQAFTGEDPPWVLKPAKNWVSGLRNADKVGINPKDQLGAAKVPMHLVPPSSIILQALCMDDGNIKYGPYNVRMEPIQAIGYISAAMRHLQAYLDGQDYDPITGKPHLGYGLATVGLVIDAWLNGTLIDNRPVPGIGGELLDALAMKPNEPTRSPAEYRTIFEAIERIGRRQSEARLGKGTP